MCVALDIALVEVIRLRLAVPEWEAIGAERISKILETFQLRCPTMSYMYLGTCMTWSFVARNVALP
jgi:hypothetical protein